MSTDTNQASEETIHEIFEGLARYNCNAFTKDTLPNEIPPYVAKVRALSLIRAEKLKLLAEVREQVVGEDESPESIPPTMSAEYHNYVHAQNKLRDEQRYSLTKLEAEL